LLSLFSPQKAEVRIIGSSPLDKIDKISYRDSANFWEEFQKEEIPSSFQIKDLEKATNELYLELVRE